MLSRHIAFFLTRRGLMAYVEWVDDNRLAVKGPGDVPVQVGVDSYT